IRDLSGASKNHLRASPAKPLLKPLLKNRGRRQKTHSSRVPTWIPKVGRHPKPPSQPHLPRAAGRPLLDGFLFRLRARSRILLPHRLLLLPRSSFSRCRHLASPPSARARHLPTGSGLSAPGSVRGDRRRSIHGQESSRRRLSARHPRPDATPIFPAGFPVSGRRRPIPTLVLSSSLSSLFSTPQEIGCPRAYRHPRLLVPVLPDRAASATNKRRLPLD
ncbi:unnamed protein product, partial [Urochloa humidicola]